MLDVIIAVVAIFLVVVIMAWEIFDEKKEQKNRFRPRVSNTMSVAVTSLIVVIAIVCANHKVTNNDFEDNNVTPTEEVIYDVAVVS